MDPCTNFSMLFGTTLLAVLGTVTTHIRLVGLPATRSSRLATSVVPSPSPSFWYYQQEVIARASAFGDYDPLVPTAAVARAYDISKVGLDVKLVSRSVFAAVQGAARFYDPETVFTCLFVFVVLALKPEVRWQARKTSAYLSRTALTTLTLALSLIPLELRAVGRYIWREALFEVGYLAHMEYTPPLSSNERAIPETLVARAVGSQDCTGETTSIETEAHGVGSPTSTSHNTDTRTVEGPRLLRLLSPSRARAVEAEVKDEVAFDNDIGPLLDLASLEVAQAFDLVDGQLVDPGFPDSAELPGPSYDDAGALGHGQLNNSLSVAAAHWPPHVFGPTRHPPTQTLQPLAGPSVPFHLRNVVEVPTSTVMAPLAAYTASSRPFGYYTYCPPSSLVVHQPQPAPTYSYRHLDELQYRAVCAQRRFLRQQPILQWLNAVEPSARA